MLTALASFSSFARECPGPAPFAPGELDLSERSEFRVTFTQDGRTAFFHVDGEGDPASQTVHLAAWTSNGWEPSRVAPFSGTWRDSDPFVSADGDAVWFSSDRPVDGGEARPDADLFVVRRAAGEWGEPVWLGPEVNSPENELYPSLSRDGELFFASDRQGATGWDLYHALPTPTGFAPAAALTELNTELWEFNPSISADGERLVFVGLRHPEGLGMGDLYTSERADGTFGPKVNLGSAVNHEGDDFHPTLAPHHQLVFVRRVWEPLTPSELWWVDTRCVPALGR